MSDATATMSSPEASAGRARKSSFFLAMRILPKAQREAMYEIYSFCRLVDDIADEGGPRPQRRAALERWRKDIDFLCDQRRPPREDLSALSVAIHTFHLRRKDFQAVIDGMDMDVVQDIQAPSFETLELYCDRVASAVGRLSVCVFGTPEAEREGLAHHLGKALQLTNILRDIDEDAEIDRLYLPREALASAGIASHDPKIVVADPRVGAACEWLIPKARAHFVAANAIMARCPRATVKAPRVMYEAYSEIFEKVAAKGFVAPRVRMSVSKGRFILSLLRHGLV